MRGKSFSLDPMEEEQATYTTAMTNTETWHKRLGHFHHAEILNMQKKELVHGLPILSSIYQATMHVILVNKQSFLSKKGAWRANMKLLLIHTDVVEP